MDKPELDRLLAKKLNQTQGFDFDPMDWEQVENRLPKSEKRRGLLAWWWLMPALGLLGMISWLTVTVFNQNKTIQQLELTTQILPTIIIKTDTIYKIKTIEKEVIKTKYITQPLPEAIKNDFNVKNNNYLNKINIIYKTPSQKRVLTTEPTTITTFDYQSLSPVNWLERRLVDRVQYTPHPLKIPDLIRLSRIIEKKKLKMTTKVGLWGALGKVKNYSTTLTAEQVPIVNRNNRQIGITGAWRFGQRLEITGSLGYQKIAYQSSEQDSIIGIYPYQLPADLTVVSLSTANIQQRVFNYELGINWHLFKFRKIQSYFGVALRAQSNLQQQQSLEFSGIPLYNSYEVTVVKDNFSYKKTAFDINSLQYRIGLQTPLGKLFSLQLEGNYNHSFKQNLQHLAAPFSLRAGLFYHLK